jgi:hypothetical protein
MDPVYIGVISVLVLLVAFMFGLFLYLYRSEGEYHAMD